MSTTPRCSACGGRIGAEHQEDVKNDALKMLSILPRGPGTAVCWYCLNAITLAAQAVLAARTK